MVQIVDGDWIPHGTAGSQWVPHKLFNAKGHHNVIRGSYALNIGLEGIETLRYVACWQALFGI